MLHCYIATALQRNIVPYYNATLLQCNALRCYNVTIETKLPRARHASTRVICYNATRYNATVAIPIRAHAHGNLEVQPAQFALLGGALRLHDLVVTQGVGDA